MTATTSCSPSTISDLIPSLRFASTRAIGPVCPPREIAGLVRTRPMLGCHLGVAGFLGMMAAAFGLGTVTALAVGALVALYLEHLDSFRERSGR